MALQSTLPNLLAFCAAYETSSFTKAAKRLGVTPQAASRSVARLEETLATVLFRRTTRRITPTEAATVYYRSAREALALLTRAEQDAAQQNELQKAVVHVSAPTTFGHARLLPSLGAFHERYPQIELDVHISNRNVDFSTEEFDFAIRMGRTMDESLIVRKLGEFPIGVYAAPEYLARRGSLKNPGQLADHDCIGFTMPSTGRLLPWIFTPGPRSWTPRACIRCAEDPLSTISLARAGLGLVQTYDFLVAEDVSRGKLIEVLRDWRGAARPFSIVYPMTPKRSPAAKSLIDYIVATSQSSPL